jgi:hypothetical protein
VKFCRSLLCFNCKPAKVFEVTRRNCQFCFCILALHLSFCEAVPTVFDGKRKIMSFFLNGGKRRTVILYHYS